MVIAFGSFPIGAVVGSPFCSFCVFSFCYLHAVHLGAPPKGTTTRLKATARAPPWGLLRAVVLCDLAFSEVMRVGAGSTVCDRSRQRNLSCVFF